jgi:hypothetical protein
MAILHLKHRQVFFWFLLSFLLASLQEMNLRRASPAVSLTFMFYSDTETIQAAFLHASFGSALTLCSFRMISLIPPLYASFQPRQAAEY